MHETLSARPPSYETTLLWAACSMCFFGFFRLGEITVPTKAAFDPTRHLAWGDISPLTKPWFIALVREVLTEAGIVASSLYSGHNFNQTGAATSGRKSWHREFCDKTLGRWSSTTFLLYICTPRQQLAKFTSTLVSSTV